MECTSCMYLLSFVIGPLAMVLACGVLAARRRVLDRVSRIIFAHLGVVPVDPSVSTHTAAQSPTLAHVAV